MLDSKSEEILAFFKVNLSISSKEIYDGLEIEIGYATVKRNLSKLVDENLISTIGKGRGRKYTISPVYNLFNIYLTFI